MGCMSPQALEPRGGKQENKKGFQTGLKASGHLWANKADKLWNLLVNRLIRHFLRGSAEVQSFAKAHSQLGYVGCQGQ